MRTLCWVFAVLLLCATQLRADEILLKNGNVIKGKITAEDNEKVVITIEFGQSSTGTGRRTIEMAFDRGKILRIRREAGLFSTRPSTSAGASNKPATKAPTEATEALVAPTATGDAATTADTTETPKSTNPLDDMDPTLRLQIEAQLKNLSSLDDEIRNNAEKRITAFGKEASPLLVQLLKTSGSMRARISACRALRANSEKRAVRALIDQLQGGRDDATRMRYAALALKAITGQALPFDEDASERSRSADRQKWVDWFATVKEDYPPQLGYDEEEAAAPAAEK